MKFLCDVHISRKIVSLLKSLGQDAIHVNDILNKSETKDAEICRYADKYNYAVVTKDADFRDSHLVKQSPKKLIKINLGNISNEKLQDIFKNNIDEILKLDSQKHFLLEIDYDDLILLQT